MSLETALRHSMLLAVASVAAGCPITETVPGDVCSAHVRVRTPDPSPLLDPGYYGLAQVSIERGGVTAYDHTVDLFGVREGGITVKIVDPATGEPPAIEPGDDFRLRLVAFVDDTGGKTALAVGSTLSFACVVGETPAPSLYLGPANGFATATIPAAGLPARVGATLSPLADGRVLVVGGTADAGGTTAATPTAALYDHAAGLFCASGAGCLTNDLPARVEHTATVLSDGSVLIVGGRTPGTTAALAEAFRYDSATLTFSALTFSGAPVLARTRHAAVLLEGFNVPSAQRGKVLLIGGCGNTCASGELQQDATLLDLSAMSASSVSLSSPVYDTTATMLTSGKVLVAGGRTTGGALSSSVMLFDTFGGSFGDPARPCAGAQTTHLCARRAGHTATLLDDGNVLLWGGSLGLVAGVDPSPKAEVFLIAPEEYSMPVTGAAAFPARAGHTASRIACAASPCPILILGGEDPASPTSPAPVPALFAVAPTPPLLTDTAYGGAVTPFTRTVVTSRRVEHAAAGLADGSVLLVGGREPGVAGTMVPGAALYSSCDVVGGVSCPVP